jgi:DNA-binding transcriptional ArsR family regulator
MQVFEALADPTRRKIVELLAHRERSAGELAGHFELSQPAVSKHLRVLREAGVVHVRGDAQKRIYRLDSATLGQAEAWLARLRSFWDERLDALEDQLRREEEG